MNDLDLNLKLENLELALAALSVRIIELEENQDEELHKIEVIEDFLDRLLIDPEECLKTK